MEMLFSVSQASLKQLGVHPAGFVCSAYAILVLQIAVVVMVLRLCCARRRQPQKRNLWMSQRTHNSRKARSRTSALFWTFAVISAASILVLYLPFAVFRLVEPTIWADNLPGKQHFWPLPYYLPFIRDQFLVLVPLGRAVTPNGLSTTVSTPSWRDLSVNMPFTSLNSIPVENLYQPSLWSSPLVKVSTTKVVLGSLAPNPTAWTDPVLTLRSTLLLDAFYWKGFWAAFIAFMPLRYLASQAWQDYRDLCDSEPKSFSY